MAATDQEELLNYYWRELTYLRQMGEVFARKHPKVASRLELERDHSPDPHVERLIECFAFLTARIRHGIDNDFPEIATELLSAIYPHYLNPIPSMSIARFDVDPGRGKLTSGHAIPKYTPLFALAEGGVVCRFRTCYPVTLWPLEVVDVRFESPEAYEYRDSGRVAAVLRIRIASSAGPLPELGLKRLRFFLNGDRMLVQNLYELLFCNVLHVAIRPDSEGPLRYLPEPALLPVGFGLDEDVIPQPRQAHPAFRLVQEYFAFGEKFLFVDVDHLDRHGSQKSFELLIFLDVEPGTRLALSPELFALGCTPIINLFPKTTEPVRVDHRVSEYRLVPDVHREKTTEIHTILSVTSSSDASDHTRDLKPFYSFSHESWERDQKSFWHARRVSSSRKEVEGTEILMSFVDLDFEPRLPATEVIFAHTWCTNRGLAEQIPAGGVLQTDESVPASQIFCLKKPTRQVHPPLDGQTLWRLVSHLSLNHLSLGEGEESLKALREILQLYSFYDARSAADQIRGIREMSERKVVRRVGSEAWRGFCRGSEITLVFDESLYVGTGAFLLASVLNCFFALYASTNAFTQLVIKSEQRKGSWKTWPPMAGEQIVL